MTFGTALVLQPVLARLSSSVIHRRLSCFQILTMEHRMVGWTCYDASEDLTASIFSATEFRSVTCFRNHGPPKCRNKQAMRHDLKSQKTISSSRVGLRHKAVRQSDGQFVLSVLYVPAVFCTESLEFSELVSNKRYLTNKLFMQFNLTPAHTSHKLQVCRQCYSGALELRNACGLNSSGTNCAS